MHFFFIFPGLPVGPAAGYGGGFFGTDVFSQWRVLVTTVLPDSDPSLNSKINGKSRGSSRRMPCPSSRRLPVALKTLKIGENSQIKHGNKAESPLSPCFDYLQYYDREFEAVDENFQLLTANGCAGNYFDREFDAVDENSQVLTANGCEGNNGWCATQSFVVGKEEKSVF